MRQGRPTLGAVRWIGAHGELVSALLGALSALCLGAPLLLHELPHRRESENCKAIRRTAGADPAQRLALLRIRDHIIESRLGEYHRYFRCTLTGFLLLFLSFVTLFAVVVS